MDEILSSPFAPVAICLVIFALIIVVLVVWIVSIDRRIRGISADLENERRRMAEIQTALARRGGSQRNSGVPRTPRTPAAMYTNATSVSGVVTGSGMTVPAKGAAGVNASTDERMGKSMGSATDIGATAADAGTDATPANAGTDAAPADSGTDAAISQKQHESRTDSPISAFPVESEEEAARRAEERRARKQRIAARRAAEMEHERRLQQQSRRRTQARAQQQPRSQDLVQDRQEADAQDLIQQQSRSQDRIQDQSPLGASPSQVRQSAAQTQQSQGQQRASEHSQPRQSSQQDDNDRGARAQQAQVTVTKQNEATRENSRYESSRSVASRVRHARHAR